MITREDVMSWRPCWSEDDVRAAAPSPISPVDLLKIETIPPDDRLWVVLRKEVLDARTLRIFACDCADRALSHASSPDPRSVNAIRVARRYADGEATEDELFTAADAAASAAYTAYAAAYAAAYADAYAYADAAAAARAADADAYAADAADAAAAYAAAYAAYAAAADAAAYAAARAAERTWQVNHLIEMLEEK